MREEQHWQKGIQAQEVRDVVGARGVRRGGSRGVNGGRGWLNRVPWPFKNLTTTRATNDGIARCNSARAPPTRAAYVLLSPVGTRGRAPLNYGLRVTRNTLRRLTLIPR